MARVIHEVVPRASYRPRCHTRRSILDAKTLAYALAATASALLSSCSLSPKRVAAASPMLAPASTLAPPTNALVLHLASFGIIGGRHDRVPPARLSCHAVIAGWIAISGPRWIAVDTIAACAADGLPLTRGRDAVAIVADSGTLAGGAADQLGFMSTITPQVLPHAAGSIGVLRGDTLWVRAVSDSRLERVYAR